MPEFVDEKSGNCYKHHGDEENQPHSYTAAVHVVEGTGELFVFDVTNRNSVQVERLVTAVTTKKLKRSELAVMCGKGEDIHVCDKDVSKI